jgi:hypothetical protein
MFIEEIISLIIKFALYIILISLTIYFIVFRKGILNNKAESFNIKKSFFVKIVVINLIAVFLIEEFSNLIEDFIYYNFVR